MLDFRSPVICGAYRLGLWAGMLAFTVGVPLSQTARAQSSAEEDVVELPPIEVVGTRILGVDLETTVPIVAYESAELATTGYARFDEALRSLSMLSGYSFDGVDEGTLGVQGVSTTNLRGMGSITPFGNGSNLVLIDGLRMPSHGIVGTETIYNLNIVPSGAIERVEILKDGGSAVYGSDAINGVTNVRTMRNYRGTRAGLRIGIAEGTDSWELGGNLVHGQRLGASGNLVFAADYYQRSRLMADEYAFSAQLDNRERGGRNNSSPYTFPAKFQVTEPGHPLDKAWVTYPTPTDSPDLGGLIETTEFHGSTDGGFNFTPWSSHLGDTDNAGAFLHLDQRLASSVVGSIELSFQRSSARNSLAPAPYFIYAEEGDPVIPAANPFNPFGVERTDGEAPTDLSVFLGRLLDLPPRIYDTTTQSPRLVAGLEGELGESWSWKASGVWSESRSEGIGLNSAHAERFEDALNGIDFNGDGRLERDEFLNPFGHNSQALMDAIRISTKETGTFALAMLDVHASGDLWRHDVLPIKGAVGAEYRWEDLEHDLDPIRNGGRILGNAGQQDDTAGDREVAAAYGEIFVTWKDIVEVQAAARIERYSDFGSTTTPKVSASLRPWSEVLLRVSAGKGFRAPDLPMLFKPLTSGYSGEFDLRDPKRDEEVGMFVRISGGNPDLEPFDAEILTAGIVLEPFKRLAGANGSRSVLGGLTFGVELIDIKYSNLADLPDVQWLIDHEDELAELFPGQNVGIGRSQPTQGETFGPIREIRAVFVNMPGAWERRDVDLWLEWPLALNEWGDLRLRWDGTLRVKDMRNGEDQVGRDWQPDIRWTGQLGWTRGPWSTNLHFRYVGGFDRLQWWPDIPVAGPQFRINAQVSYEGWRDLRVTLGARNLLDEDPPFDGTWPFGYAQGFHSFEKRFWYLQLDREW